MMVSGFDMAGPSANLCRFMASFLNGKLLWLGYLGALLGHEVVSK